MSSSSIDEAVRLDPHADTGALTPNADWIKCCIEKFSRKFLVKTILYPISARCQSASVCMRIQPKSKKLTNHNQLFFLHSTVIGQFFTLTASFILLLLIVDHALKAMAHRKT